VWTTQDPRDLWVSAPDFAAQVPQVPDLALAREVLSSREAMGTLEKLALCACVVGAVGCGEEPDLCARVVFVDPPVVWNGAATEISVYALDVVAPVQVVSIAPAGTANETRLDFEATEGFLDRPLALVPAGTAPGSYDVILRDAGTGCTEKVDGGLTVSDEATLQLTGVSPTVGFGPEVNTLELTASDTPGFGELPIVYLTGDALPKAIRLGGVVPHSKTSLVAETPANLPAGTYDILVVNQDGTAGILEDGYNISVSAPPAVTSISPKHVPTTATTAITVTGTNFRTPTVTFRCVGPTGNAFPDQNANVTGSTASTINATINTNAHAAGANCVVVVTNAGDNARTEFSSLVVVTAQQNLTGFAAGPALTQPRQYLGSAAGVAGKQGFVYAIAGDNGQGALRSVEFVGADNFGRPGAGFIGQRNQLNDERTELGVARVGRYIYAIGGTELVGDPAGALQSVERAVILDPQFNPKDLRSNIKFARTGGSMDGGIYYYRVAAIMSGEDPFNPNGETLASSTLAVQFPSVTGRSVQVELSWTPVPGAVRYRIYRTEANGAPGTEGLIADTNDLPETVTCSGPTTCTDLGAIADLEVNPLPVGATGRWDDLDEATLDTPRRGLAVAAAIDPVDPTKAYIYALGGQDDAGNALATYEIIQITINPDGSQIVTDTITGTGLIGTPRWHVGGYAVTSADSTRVNGTRIWVGAGETTPGNMTSDFDSAQVQPGGQLGPFTTTAATAPFAGYGAFAAGDYLYVLGGQNGQPNTTNLNVELTAGGGLTDFEGFTPGMLSPRKGLGSTAQSGNFYILGGSNGSDVLTSTEFVLY
jgi:hypothetical protein